MAPYDHLADTLTAAAYTVATAVAVAMIALPFVS